MAGLDDQRTVTRTEAAEYLREFADKLASGTQPGAENPSPSTTAGDDRTTDAVSSDTTPRDGDRDTATHGVTEERGHEHDETSTAGASGRSNGKVTFLVGNDSATVHPPEELTLGVEVGEDSAMMSSGAETVTFSLHWDAEAVPESDELRIE